MSTREVGEFVCEFVFPVGEKRAVRISLQHAWRTQCALPISGTPEVGVQGLSKGVQGLRACRVWVQDLISKGVQGLRACSCRLRVPGPTRPGLGPPCKRDSPVSWCQLVSHRHSRHVTPMGATCWSAPAPGGRSCRVAPRPAAAPPGSSCVAVWRLFDRPWRFVWPWRVITS